MAKLQLFYILFLYEVNHLFFHIDYQKDVCLIIIFFQGIFQYFY